MVVKGFLWVNHINISRELIIIPRSQKNYILRIFERSQWMQCSIYLDVQQNTNGVI